ncbi:hypothetical protein ACQ86B_28855 (plasmid) [Mycolicibacterium aichiense]|uniref:hypothetical protein n=1 Tax=Mycolicibacterium aichiense TaxID=1799 RepID=UPI003D674E2E
MNNPQQPTWPTAGEPQQSVPPHAPAPHHPSPWSNTPAPQAYPVPTPYRHGPQYAAAARYRTPGEPIFTVRLRKHTGLALTWLSQSYTVTGTFHQCEAAIKDAQLHNLAAGWWSVASIVLWNWIALGANANARKTLHRTAGRYGYVPLPK